MEKITNLVTALGFAASMVFACIYVSTLPKPDYTLVQDSFELTEVKLYLKRRLGHSGYAIAQDNGCLDDIAQRLYYQDPWGDYDCYTMYSHLETETMDDELYAAY